MRNISFAMTTPQMLAGTKDVTRRMGWLSVQPGEMLRGIEKGQGLKKGETVKPLAIILLLDVRVERLDRMLTDRDYGLAEVKREGFPEMTPEQFVEFFCANHTGCFPDREITRLEFQKLPLLHERQNSHMRLQGGAMYGYDIFDPVRERTIGTKVVHIDKKKRPWAETTTYVLLDPSPMLKFDNPKDFMIAYQQQLQGAAK